MAVHPLRDVEKLFIHTNAAPEITRHNAEKYCLAMQKVSLKSSILNDTVTIYRFEGDFLFIPSPLKVSAKKAVVKDVLTRLLYPPYRNSLDRSLKIDHLNIYQAYQEGTTLTIPIYEDPTTNIKLRQDPYAPQSVKDAFAQGIALIEPLELIKKIRWSSLGIYYDWEKKAYDGSVSNPIPKLLAEACQEISSKLCQVDSFFPETAMVNYYQQKDRIMAHTDRNEEDMTKPLISFSFGCSAVFIVGKKEKEDANISTFLLEDGDIAVLLNDSREYFHGVPKILPDNAGEEDYRGEEYHPLIAGSRINISVRQAFRH
ncbi:alkylated DNA repair protein alkB -like 1 [Nematocida displodere]|uniref:Alkylated DNA repair protein alkB-like 1 n=1 Tax=Nematocida displodere TaxID=1805483 RepID=A0A177EEP8_9MICR|nr:alkylated DNA repair protein alkB -like 1 [Nematocida displodere]